MTGVVFLISLCAAMALGIPIALSLLVCGIVMMLFMGNFDSQIVASTLMDGADNFPLMAIPFFILAGELMNAGGISKRIIDFAMALVGHIKGGFGYVAIIASLIFAGLSGSAVADTAALAAVLVPMMAGAGYDRPKSGALIAAAGILAPVIPPSECPTKCAQAIPSLSIHCCTQAAIAGRLGFVSQPDLPWLGRSTLNTAKFACRARATAPRLLPVPNKPCSKTTGAPFPMIS